MDFALTTPGKFVLFLRSEQQGQFVQAGSGWLVGRNELACHPCVLSGIRAQREGDRLLVTLSQSLWDMTLCIVELKGVTAAQKEGDRLLDTPSQSPWDLDLCIVEL